MMKLTDQTVIVAADGGGTGCRAAAGTLESGMLATATGGPGNVHSDFDGAVSHLTGAIDLALAEAGLAGVPRDRITAHLGVAGAHSEVEMAAVQAVLPYGRSAVTGDRATSVRGVLGETDGFVIALGAPLGAGGLNCRIRHQVPGWVAACWKKPFWPMMA
jgi:glucosamine kinase